LNTSENQLSGGGTLSESENKIEEIKDLQKTEESRANHQQALGFGNTGRVLPIQRARYWIGIWGGKPKRTSAYWAKNMLEKRTICKAKKRESREGGGPAEKRETAVKLHYNLRENS